MTDLQILRKILQDLHYSEDYVRILEEKALHRLMDTGLEDMTPSFLYVTFAYDLGKATARKIADYFDEMKKQGNYTSEFDKLRQEKSVED